MEKVYENNNILFKILPCLLIALYLIMCLFGSTVCATDVADNEILISTKFYGDFTIPKPPKDLYYAFFTHTFQNSRYSFVYVFSYNPIEFSIDYNTKIITATSSSCIYQSSFGVGDKNTYISTAKRLDYDDIKNKLNSGEYKNSALFNLTNFSTNSIASDITSSNNCNFKVAYDENNNLVFPKASQELAGVTISAIQSAEEIPQAIVKMMKVVIPVGLVVLGIGLLIYLIKSVILRMQ